MSTIERGGSGLTVLGANRTISYKVSIMLEAYNNLYEPNISTLLPNYIYLRFLPQSIQDIKNLLESGIELWDHPLDYDIDYYGERYEDPSVTDPNYTRQYAVAPVGRSLPSVPYEVLEELALVSEECPLAQEAFRITGNDYQVPGNFDPDPPLVSGKFGELLEQGDPGGSTGGGNPPPGNTGDCGCPIPGNVCYPSGCVQVFDNMLNAYEGVKHVEVHTSKTHIFGELFHREDETNDSGCWLIDHDYHGKIHVWVRWESGTCDIKTMDGNLDLLGYSFARRNYIGAFDGPYFNNLPIKFDYTSAIGSSQFRDWVASTTNNAVHEFGAYKTLNGILTPLPDDLKITTTPWQSGDNIGAAPMLDKIGFIPVYYTGSQPLNILSGVFGIFKAVNGISFAFLAAWLDAAAPDITLNLNISGEVNADDIRDLVYHELSHALHFAKVGKDYWVTNTAYVVDHNGYGSADAPGAGRCSVIESWGFAFGTIATHLRYGILNSNGGNPAFDTWRALLEENHHWGGDTPPGFPALIPMGWLWDIQDNNFANPLNELENVLVVQAGGDAVNGVTGAQIFNTMEDNMLSMPQMKAALIPYLPTTVSTTQYNILSGAYGF